VEEHKINGMEGTSTLPDSLKGNLHGGSYEDNDDGWVYTDPNDKQLNSQEL
jgi:hypothetical protein